MFNADLGDLHVVILEFRKGLADLHHIHHCFDGGLDVRYVRIGKYMKV